jgi:hypothetical protein
MQNKIKEGKKKDMGSREVSTQASSFSLLVEGKLTYSSPGIKNA